MFWYLKNSPKIEICQLLLETSSNSRWHNHLQLGKVSNFFNETLIFCDFLITFLCFFSRRMERILPRGKNRRGKTARPLCSSLFSFLHSSPGQGFFPCTTKSSRPFFFLKMCSNFCLQITFFVFFKKCFPLLFTFFTTESSENRPEGRKEEKRKVWNKEGPILSPNTPKRDVWQ